MFCPIRAPACVMFTLVLLAPAAARAQGAAMPTCLTLLPPEAIVKTLGETYRDMGSEVGRSGASDCEWAVRRARPGSRRWRSVFSTPWP